MHLHALAIIVLFLRSSIAFLPRYGSSTLPELHEPLMRDERLPASTLVRAFSAPARPGEARTAFAGDSSIVYGHPFQQGFTESAVERSKPLVSFVRKHLHSTLDRT